MPAPLQQTIDASRQFIRGLSLRMLILVGLWALYILWTGYGVLIGGWMMPARPSSFPLPGAVSINLWGCAAGLAFGAIVANMVKWGNGKRLIFGGIAFAMMLGRLNGATSLLLYLPFDTGFLLPLGPFILLIGGVFAIVTIFAVAIALFSAFVAIPVLLFNLPVSHRRGHRDRFRGLARQCYRR